VALRALRDTFAMEPIYGVETRRIVKAGTIVPPHYRIDPNDVEEVASGRSVVGGSTMPPQPRITTPPDYAGMTLSQLKEAAIERGIVVTPEAKKADILAALEK
jgi:hypothetical protein